MTRDPSFWRQWFMGMADHVALASKDPSTKVGAVIADERRVIRGVGYNGFPRGVADDAHRYDDRATKYKYVVYAEANAILNSTGARGCTLYATLHPCSACASLIIQAGIRIVVCRPTIARWADDALFTQAMLVEAGVELVIAPAAETP